MFLRPLLHAWLKKAVAATIRDTVVAAANEQLKPGVNELPAGKLQPCHLGFVFALGIESGCFEDLVDGVVAVRASGLIVREGGVRGRRVAIVVSGPGSKSAQRATEILIDGHRPGRVISAGFAGALSPQLKRNDIIVADRLLNTEGGDFAVELPKGLAAHRSQPDVHCGPLLTVDRVVRSPSDKKTLADRSGALGVDMEAFTVAEVCRRLGVAFSSVRVVSDTSKESLPADVEHLLVQKSTAARAGAALGAIWRRPASAMDFYQLRENALIASGRLAKFLAGCDFD